MCVCVWILACSWSYAVKACLCFLLAVSSTNYQDHIALTKTFSFSKPHLYIFQHLVLCSTLPTVDSSSSLLSLSPGFKVFISQLLSFFSLFYFLVSSCSLSFALLLFVCSKWVQCLSSKAKGHDNSKGKQLVWFCGESKENILLMNKVLLKLILANFVEFCYYM